MSIIVFKKDIVSTENLPLRYVLYPGHYGAFFAFSNDLQTNKFVFCSCAREAILNYIKLRLIFNRKNNADVYRNFILDSFDFPFKLVQFLFNKGVREDENIIDELLFEHKICHECNRRTPLYKYCHPMYGGMFKQTYGWYICKQFYEWGLDPINNKYIPELCPDEVLDLMSIDANNYVFKVGDDLSVVEDFHKQQRLIWNVVENEVRRKFGHKKIGESWSSETILYYIVKSLYKSHEIKRHFRPKYLEGLELDIFLPNEQLGIEYQGIQHYKPVPYWGGEDAFIKLIERDEKKKRLCESLGIKLIYFDYDEDLNESYVMDKISYNILENR